MGMVAFVIVLILGTVALHEVEGRGHAQKKNGLLALFMRPKSYKRGGVNYAARFRNPNRENHNFMGFPKMRSFDFNNFDDIPPGYPSEMNFRENFPPEDDYLYNVGKIPAHFFDQPEHSGRLNDINPYSVWIPNQNQQNQNYYPNYDSSSNWRCPACPGSGGSLPNIFVMNFPDKVMDQLNKPNKTTEKPTSSAKPIKTAPPAPATPAPVQITTVKARKPVATAKPTKPLKIKKKAAGTTTTVKPKARRNMALTKNRKKAGKRGNRKGRKRGRKVKKGSGKKSAKESATTVKNLKLTTSAVTTEKLAQY